MAAKTSNGKGKPKYQRATKTVAGKRVQFYGKTKKEAKAKLAAYEEELERVHINYSKSGFDVVFCDWYNEKKKPTLSPKSVERYDCEYRLRIKGSELAQMLIGDITDMAIQKHYNHIQKTYSANAVFGCHKLLQPFFTYCYNSGKLKQNPMLAVEMTAYQNAEAKREKKRKEQKKTLTAAEIKILEAATDKDNSLFIFQFAMQTGLRIGEILALQHNDIIMNIDKSEVIGNVQVDKTGTYMTIDGKYQHYVDEPKSEAGTRTVPLRKELERGLAAHIAAEKMKFNRLGIKWTANSPLFTNSVCKYWDGGKVRKVWDDVQIDLGIKRIKFHGLRATFGTQCAMHGVSKFALATIMGHSNPKMTEEYYIDLKGETKYLGGEISKLSQPITA
jgi:integrase